MTRGLGGRPASGRRQRMRRLRLAAVAGLFAASPGSASADDLRIVDIKAFVFLERADRLSDDLIGAAALVNAPRGGAPGGDTATGLMVDPVFQRDKAASEGQKSAPSKNALATVDLTQTSLAGQRIVTHKVFDDLDFGAGTDHKVVFLEGATCMPLVVDVHAGKSSKTARLGFKCDPAQAAQK
jgi:hypothetical protein